MGCFRQARAPRNTPNPRFGYDCSLPRHGFANAAGSVAARRPGAAARKCGRASAKSRHPPAACLVIRKHFTGGCADPKCSALSCSAVSAFQQLPVFAPGWWRSYAMEKLSSASALIAKSRPERPVRGLRPHAAGRAARWFLEKFPGDVAYAYKANSSVFLIGALYGAGIRHFDVASLPEIEDAATIPDAHLHFMHPVKSRHAIRRAYELGVRSFALDGEDELDKIVEATGGARDLLLWVRIAVPAINSRIPLERKFGVARREGREASGQDAPGGRRAGSHLPRRLADDDARRLRHGAGRRASPHRQVGRHDRPPRHRRRLPLALSRQRSRAPAGLHGRASSPASRRCR